MSLLGKRKGRTTTRIQFDSILRNFLSFLKRQLNIKYEIPIILVDDVDFSKNIAAFGEISNKNIIHISIVNRHPVDILRTVAHEYVHYKQHLDNGFSNGNSHAGSATENKANAKAGELIKKYADMHPELFELMPIR